MGVYVDNLRPCNKTNKWRYSKSCHLFADTVMELHEFAETLDLKRAWFQEGILPHYDLTENKRHHAVRNGAKEVDDCFVVNSIRRFKDVRLSDGVR